MEPAMPWDFLVAKSDLRRTAFRDATTPPRRR
jgi:hypothetical protein